jgi:hypothetical protein
MKPEAPERRPRRSLALLAAALLLVAPLSSACVYTHISMPMDTNLQETRLGDKVGRSHFQSVAGLVAWGDAGTQAAAEDGNLTVLHHADREILTVLLGLYFRHTTVVYGE